MFKTQLRIRRGQLAEGQTIGCEDKPPPCDCGADQSLLLVVSVAQEVSLPSSSIMLAVEVLSDELC